MCDLVILERNAAFGTETTSRNSEVIHAGMYYPKDTQKANYRKGVYFTYAAKSPFTRLIYPVPVPGGLGIHSTVDLGGQVRFGS